MNDIRRHKRFVILVRNPRNDKIWAIRDEGEDYAAVYATEDEADKAALEISVCKVWPYSIVEAP